MLRHIDPQFHGMVIKHCFVPKFHEGAVVPSVWVATILSYEAEQKPQAQQPQKKGSGTQQETLRGFPGHGL